MEEQVEEGKCAACFTHHLRITQLHRSASPQFHRFLVPMLVSLSLAGLPRTINTTNTTHMMMTYPVPGPSSIPAASVTLPLTAEVRPR